MIRRNTITYEDPDGKVVICENIDKMAEVDWEEIGGWPQRMRDRWVVDKAETIEAGSLVLDVGAGTCTYRFLFDHCNYKTHDFGKYTGKKRGDTTEYGDIDYRSDITNIPVPDGFFDVILCTEVLEHVPEPIEALREMARILKPDGRIFITAPLGSDLHQTPYHFYGGFTPEWYEHFFPEFGLKIITIVSNGGFFKTLAQRCVKAMTLAPQCRFDKKKTEFIRYLFGRWLPWYLFGLNEKCFIGEATDGYFVEGVKPNAES